MTVGHKILAVTRERPTSPRVQPVEKVAIRARENSIGGLVRPVNLSATLAHNRAVSKAIARPTCGSPTIFRNPNDNIAATMPTSIPRISRVATM